MSCVGASNVAVACRFAPKRGFTVYWYCCVAGSKPCTKSSVGSANDGAPHPCRLFEPWMSASSPVSGFAMPSEIVARSGTTLIACDTSETRRLSVVYHGPWQLLRPAIVPSCFSRHDFTELGAPVSRLCIPADSAESAATFDGS